MIRTTHLGPTLFAAVLLTVAFNAPYAAAQDAQPPAQNKGGVGGFLKKLGKGIDDAVKTGTQGTQGAVDTINQTHAAVNGTVRGRVALQSGKTVTCFNGITACYLGPANMTSPGQSQGVPMMLVLPDGSAVANNADELAQLGVLVLPQTGVASGNTDTGYSDGLGAAPLLDERRNCAPPPRNHGLPGRRDHRTRGSTRPGTAGQDRRGTQQSPAAA